MDTFKLWILSVCGASAITSLCRLLVSKSKLKKTTNIFFSLFILLYMFLPFVNSDNKFFNNDDIECEISFDFNYRDGYEKLVNESIKSLCKEMGVEVISVDIDSYTDEDGNLLINSLFVNINDKSRTVETENAIKNKLGFEVTVT